MLKSAFLAMASSDATHNCHRGYACARGRYPVDANFGMFPEDLQVAEDLYLIQMEYGWPKKLDVATGKNKKDRVIAVQ